MLQICRGMVNSEAKVVSCKQLTHNCTNVVIWAYHEGVILVLDTGIQLLCNLVKDVCFSVKQLLLCSPAQCAYWQSNFWIPVSATFMTQIPAAFHRIYALFFLDPSGLCCIATHKRPTIQATYWKSCFFSINLIRFKNSNLLFVLINLILFKIAKALKCLNFS
jgi:hypothetical protein